jgi:hypothetical protein
VPNSPARLPDVGLGPRVGLPGRGTARRGLCSSAAPAADPVPPNRIYFTIFHPRTSLSRARARSLSRASSLSPSLSLSQSLHFAHQERRDHDNPSSHAPPTVDLDVHSRHPLRRRRRRHSPRRDAPPLSVSTQHFSPVSLHGGDDSDFFPRPPPARRPQGHTETKAHTEDSESRWGTVCVGGTCTSGYHDF